MNIERFFTQTLPTTLDRLRVFPRIFFGIYIYLLFDTHMWYIALTDPSGAQQFMVSTVYGVGAAWFGLYVSTGNKNVTYDDVSISTDGNGSSVDVSNAKVIQDN